MILPRKVACALAEMPNGACPDSIASRHYVAATASGAERQLAHVFCAPPLQTWLTRGSVDVGVSALPSLSRALPEASACGSLAAGQWPEY